MPNHFEDPHYNESILEEETLVPTMEKSFVHSIGELEELFPSFPDDFPDFKKQGE